jgi:uncharacterized membrane protein YphA (DoxX/SURF4 family)
VSGVLDPVSERYQRGRLFVKDLLEGWLPLGARLVSFGLATLLLLAEIPDFPTWLPHLQAVGWESANFWLWLLVIVCVPATVAILLGVIWRMAALPLMVLAWLDVAANGLSWMDNGWLFVAAAIVTHAGSGRWALLQPEESLLNVRPGSKHSISPP